MFLLMTLIAFFADGVVYESRALEYETWKWAFYQQGRYFSPEEYRAIIGMDKQEITDHFYNIYGCTWDPEVFDLQEWEYGNIVSKGITPKEGVFELMKQLPTCYIINKDTPLENYIYLTDSGRMAKKLSSMGYHVFGLRAPWTSDDDFSTCIKVFDSISEIEPHELWLE